MKTPLAFALVVTTATLAAFGCDQRSAPRSGDTSVPTPPVTPAADNTSRNRADAPSDVTPIDQSNSSIAIAVTAAIRQAIMSDSSMSMMAQNCKIVTDKDGVVTLRGPVASQSEKDSIEAKAKAVTDVKRVVNELEVKAP